MRGEINCRQANERTKSRNGICRRSGRDHAPTARGREEEEEGTGTSEADLEENDAGGLLRAAGSSHPGADQPNLPVVSVRRARPRPRPRVGPNLGVGQDAVPEREPALPPPAAVVGPLVQHALHRDGRSRRRRRRGLRLRRQRRRGVPRQRRRGGEAAQRGVVEVVVVAAAAVLAFPVAAAAPSASHALRHPALRRRRRRGNGRDGTGGNRREVRSPRQSPRFIFSSGWSLFMCGPTRPLLSPLSWLQTSRALFGIFFFLVLAWPVSTKLQQQNFGLRKPPTNDTLSC